MGRLPPMAIYGGIDLGGTKIQAAIVDEGSDHEVLGAKRDQTPLKDIEKFCAFAGISTARFFDIAERFRNRGIWLRKDGTWTIPGFFIPDWDWREIHPH